MKHLPKIMIGALTATLLPLTALADKDRYYDFAPVTDVEPIYTMVEHRIPRESCWMERVRVEESHRRHGSGTSTLVGGVIGGAIGHAVGHGKDNKKIGAVVGSMLGASIGSDIGRQRHGHDQTRVRYENVERCETDYSIEREERLDGYNVTYKYHGETYQTRMREHPGKRIKVRVAVTPMTNY